MYNENVVGVVVPAYNEEGFVGRVIETLPPFVDRAYVIDDCSTDGTWDEIQAAAKEVNSSVDARDRGPSRSSNGIGLSDDSALATRHSHRSDGGSVDGAVRYDRGNGSDDVAFDGRIVPIQHERNRGVGGAIKTGYQRALTDGIDVVAVMGGDGQMRPEELHRYLDPIVAGEVDYTKGNRLLNREFRQSMSSWRLFGNWILTFLTKIASGYWRTMDPQNGYTAISREALEAVDIDRMYEDYGYCNDLLVRLNVAELRVGDVPRRANYGDETSSIRYHTYIPRVSAMLLRDFLWRLRVKYLVRRFHPLTLLYGLGAGATAYGAVSLLRAVLPRSRARDSEPVTDVTSGVTLVVLGWIAMVLAMVFDLEENADKERRFDE
ncbi:glycosyltransferase family 2 protein [Halobellus captivus]|uniref:glycosyltransferase family 2 protein n=1 Tax=Halobellus captivus TaxID=2592614 RepID=UPI0011A6DB77|nr:glycosyltransferase family 2 protein [Halobellus captivus]